MVYHTLRCIIVLMQLKTQQSVKTESIFRCENIHLFFTLICKCLAEGIDKNEMEMLNDHDVQ